MFSTNKTSAAGLEKYVTGSARSIAPVHYQTAHGYAGGEILYRKSDSTYALAIATAGDTAEVLGCVNRSEGTDRFSLVTDGEAVLTVANFQEGTLTGLVDGAVLFLSATTAGKFTWTEPSVVGQIRKPLMKVTSISGGIVKGQFTGSMLGTTVGGTNVSTVIGLTLATSTVIQNVSGWPVGGGGKINGTITVLTSGAAQGCRVEINFQKISSSAYNISAAFPASSIVAASGTLSASVNETNGNISITLPTITGATSASVTFSIDSAALGATIPLQIDGTLVSEKKIANVITGAGTLNATPNAYQHVCNSASPFTLNVSTAVGNDGCILKVKNIGAGTVTLDFNSTETADGSTTQDLVQWESVVLMAYSGNWLIVG